MKLFDTTLRDGGNVVGHGFSAELTVSIVRGLLSAGIADIELGNCKGIGAYEKLGATKALSDQAYFQLLRPYAEKGRLGMFVIASLADEDAIRAAADAGMYFLRVGANAGDGKGSLDAIRMVKGAGLYCRYALMKGYVLSPEELAAATLKKEGYLPEVDLFQLLDYLDQELIPAMAPYGYHVAVNPTDLMLGLSGCHSNFLPMFRKVAEDAHVPLLRLIAEVSAVDRKAPDESLLRTVAEKLKS